MHLGDVIRLALGALWQRKTRTALALLGVAVGSFALVASLAIGQGVEHALLEQVRRQDALRRIYVYPGVGPRAAEVPAEQLEVPGEMTEARRERLREAIRRRYEAPTRPATSRGVTPEQIASLERLDHVVAVLPALSWQVRLRRGEREVIGNARTVGPHEVGITRRLLAGRGFEPGEEAVMVSEYAAYRWGLLDEDSLPGALEEPIRVELIQQQAGVANLLAILNVSRPDLSPGDRRVLQRVVKKLPQALAGLDLSAEERKVVSEVLSASPAQRKPVSGTWPVVGVFRDVSRTELAPWDAPPRPADLAVSPEVARRLYFATPGRTGAGLPAVTLRVTHERHLREVEKAVKELGFDAFSLADLVDQLRLNVLLITLACTFIAAVALTVAGLGITNTMLMSVLERTHEIGVMKATGATDADVMRLFLVEGGLIGVAGALLGLLVGWLSSFPGDRIAQHIVATQTPMQLEESVFAFAPWLVLGVPLGVSLLATLAAVYPARRAARLDPLSALRER